jgi:hypothetical protein
MTSPYTAGLGAFLLLLVTRGLPAQQADAERVREQARLDAVRARQLAADAAVAQQRAQQEAQAARAEVEKLRELLEVERAKATQALEAARAAEADARQRADAARQEAARALAAVREGRAPRGRGGPPEADRARRDNPSGLDPALALLENRKKEITVQYEDQRAKILAQLKQLDEERDRALEQVDTRKAQLVRQLQEQTDRQRQEPAPTDKLDQILQRLDAIETRLNRMERSGGPDGRPRRRPAS